MIDTFVLLLVHGVLFLALFRLAGDDTVDDDPALHNASRKEPESAGE
jgi:hypothetical protein